MYQQQLFDQQVDATLIKNWEVNSNTSDYNLSRIKDEIQLGNDNKGGINLKPFYQREYKFTKKDESLLIESLLGGIPIPVIYLASDTSKIPHVSNVIDGQHRLMAVNRFLNNKFALTGLKKFSKLNNLFFSDLHPSIQNKLLYQISLKLEFIHVQDDPELEIEIFTRYNQGTNPLTPQEIRHVVFNSFFNNWLIEKVDEWKEKPYIRNIFNINKKRYGDKSIHQELYVMFGLFMNLETPNYSIQPESNKKIHDIKVGINQEFYSSTEYVVEFMSYARRLDEAQSCYLIKKCEEFFISFLSFLKTTYYDNELTYPLSKEIFQSVKTKNYKMQTSILMIMTSVFHYVLSSNLTLTSDTDIAFIKERISHGFNNSEFPHTTSSTTEPKFLVRTISTIIDSIEKESV